PGIILARWLAGAGAGPFELIVSPHILVELERTLTKPYYRTRRSQPQIESAERFVASVATVVVPTIVVSGVTPHAEDDLVLAAAVSAQADYLVTGDKRFQMVGAYMGVAILSPRAFLDYLEQTGVEEA
ncbi:MAG: PIN domain-containing protein, partial [Chloroflexota bacterium]|nr:PIN domain-containing protein [Chloroflexota bacterium]